jgi:hypothetical protein|nr:MAG TPA: vesicle-associated membrane protein 2 [Caudoviricetes sp.]
MKRMFLLFVVSVFCCLLFPAVAQERLYTVTETELTQLESISENLKISRRNLLLQVSDLTERLKAQEKKAKSLTEKLQQAESTASTLNSQLQTERESLTSLTESYNKYVKDTSETIAEKQALIDEQKDTLHRRMVTIIILSTALVGFIIFAMIKLKRFFPFLP